MILLHIKIKDVYRTSFRKNTANKKSSNESTKQIRLMFLSNFINCGNKNRGVLKNEKLLVYFAAY